MLIFWSESRGSTVEKSKGSVWLRKELFAVLPVPSRAPRLSILPFVRCFKRKLFVKYQNKKKVVRTFWSLITQIIINYNNGTYFPSTLYSSITIKLRMNMLTSLVYFLDWSVGWLFVSSARVYCHQFKSKRKRPQEEQISSFEKSYRYSASVHLVTWLTWVFKSQNLMVDINMNCFVFRYFCSVFLTKSPLHRHTLLFST